MSSFGFRTGMQDAGPSRFGGVFWIFEGNREELRKPQDREPDRQHSEHRHHDPR
jgi:hypothetical protein